MLCLSDFKLYSRWVPLNKGAFPLSCSFYVLVRVQLTWVNKMEEIILYYNFMKGRALT